MMYLGIYEKSLLFQNDNCNMASFGIYLLGYTCFDFFNKKTNYSFILYIICIQRDFGF